MYNKINIFLPTYKRVNNGKLPLFIESIKETVSNTENIMVSFLVNSNDVDTIDYIKKITELKYHVLYENEIEPHLARFYNYLYEATPYKDSLVTMLGDDMIFITKNWDSIILNEINKMNGFGFVWCNDLNQKEKLPVNLFTTREFVTATKHPFMCETFASYFIDTIWERLRKYGKYLNDVIIQHKHYTLTQKKDSTSLRLDNVKMDFKKAYKIVDSYSNKIIKNLEAYRAV